MSIFNGKYISAHTIIDKVYRDMGMVNELNINDAIEWIGEAVELIGAPTSLIDKVEVLEVSEFKTKIPCELHLLIGAAASPGEYVGENECASDLSFTPMRYSTDIFHKYLECMDKDAMNCDSSLTYKVNDDYMFSSFRKGYVKLAYRAIPVDKNGFPLVPDQIKCKEAVAAHLKWKLSFILMIQGKMQQGIFQKIEQDRDWYMGAAQTAMTMPGVDMMESLKNNWLRLIPKINQHASGFKSVGSAEQRNTHNSVLRGISPDKTVYSHTS